MTTTPKQEAHTETPLTDAKAHTREIRNLNAFWTVEEVSADFARTLELKNSALVEALEDMLNWTDGKRVNCKAETYNELCKAARRALELARTPTPGGKP